MNQMLQYKQRLKLDTGRTCIVRSLLGSGGQGEVYHVEVDGEGLALKWYLPEQATDQQRAAICDLIRCGAPNGKFLWPLDLVRCDTNNSFGYLMPLREERYKGIVDMMKRRAEPSFRALCIAGYQLADSYLQLHTKGLCYRDISFGNVFLDPETGEIRICDNDNIAVTGSSSTGILGTPRFMAPEIVRGDAQPSVETDLFSLAILLFYMFMLSHPLEGQCEASIHCFDLPAMKKIFGDEPLFIWHPDNNSNRPVPGYHDNAIAYWDIYPQFFKDMFTKVFTEGINSPLNGRIRESEWRKAFAKLRDTILYCTHCGLENFLDTKEKESPSGHHCWSCGENLHLPPRLKLGANDVMLNHDTQIFPHHLGQLYDFRSPIATVNRHPSNPHIWGLKNISADKWIVHRMDGTVTEVPPERSCTLTPFSKIVFGATAGEIII